MAITVKGFVLPDSTVLDAAYLKISSITTSKIDYEYLEPIPDTEDLLTTWISRVETKVNCYIFADHIARKNQVAPLDWFQFEFKYELSDLGNIYEQAYLKLLELYPEGESN